MAVLEPDDSKFNPDTEWMTIKFKHNIEALLVKTDPKNPDKVNQELLIGFRDTALALSQQLQAISKERNDQIRTEKLLELKEALIGLIYRMSTDLAAHRTLQCQLLSDSLPTLPKL